MYIYRIYTARFLLISMLSGPTLRDLCQEARHLGPETAPMQSCMHWCCPSTCKSNSDNHGIPTPCLEILFQNQATCRKAHFQVICLARQALG